MKLALIGIDPFLKLASDAAASSPAHEISIVCDATDAAAEVLAKHPGATRIGEWETLLAGGDFDVLLVGTSSENSELRTEQLRRFVQEGVHAVLVQPAAEAIVLHELEMIQRDTRSLLSAWNPVLAHPAAQAITTHFNQSATEDISHVAFQRALPNADWPAVLTQLSRDAQWVRHWIGPPDRVTALAPIAEGNMLRNLAVTFVGPTSAIAQWTLSGTAGEDVITIAGGSTRAVWKTSRDGASVVTLESPERRNEWTFTFADSQRQLGENLLAFLDDALAKGEAIAQFDDASRAVELAEAASESNRRSRTIHLHYEEHSEQQTFKSVMAAGGCLLLLAVLFMLGVSIAIDSIGEPVRNNPWWRMWPVCLLAPVVLFLLAQTLWRVFASAKP